MAMVYPRLIVGIVITRTLLVPVARGWGAVATITVVLMRAHFSAAAVVMPAAAAASVSALFFPRLERKRLAL